MGFVASRVGLLISPMENLPLRLTPEKFWKFGIFPGESGCLKASKKDHDIWKLSN